MTDLPFPRGVRDLLPNEALFKAGAVEKIESVFRAFGFLTISTPKIESLKILKGKSAIGEDEKLIYELKEEDLGLRYDQTVSLARYYIMHNSLPLPFKRYAIGEAWRMDEPQHLRYREFTQADVDIIGGERSLCDAEVIATIASALDALDIKYEILVNSRVIMEDMLDAFDVPEDRHIDIMRIIDKLDKAGSDGVNQMLEKAGLNGEQRLKIVNFVGAKGTNEEKLKYAKDFAKGEEACDELGNMIGLVKKYPIKGDLKIDFSIVRGIDYYTGMVFEVRATDEGAPIQSLCGGGRYDKLIENYGGKSVPAVGGTIGVDRVLDLLKFSYSKRYTFAKAFVAYIRRENYDYALSVANKLRQNGINTEINLADRNISNQLSYISSMNIEYAVVVGDIEQKEGKVKLRNMVSGEEEVIGLDVLVQKLK